MLLAIGIKKQGRTPARPNPKTKPEFTFLQLLKAAAFINPLKCTPDIGHCF